MKCIEFQSAGHPADVLKIGERDRPAPGPGEVLVRMIASPVNPSDLMFVKGEYGQMASLPQIPGFEGVGVVEESGGGMRGTVFRGKRVAVLNRAGGNWADYAVVPAEQVIPLSKSLSDEQAATFFVNPATAWVMTQEVLRVPRGEWLLQTAAASSLGKMIIRLGKSIGFRTLNVVRSEKDVETLLRLGADRVLVFDSKNSSSESFAAEVAETVGSAGLKFAVDAVGGQTGSAVVNSLTSSGRMLAFGTLSSEPLQFSPRTLMKNSLTIEGFWLGRFMERQNLFFKLRLVRRLTKLIRTGILTTEIAQTFGLDQVDRAIECATTPGAGGKTLFIMKDG